MSIYADCSKFIGLLVLSSAPSLGCSSNATSSDAAPSTSSGGAGNGGAFGGGGVLAAAGGFGGGVTSGSGGAGASGGTGNASGGFPASGGRVGSGSGGTTGGSGGASGGGSTGDGGASEATSANPIRYVFVVAMENHDQGSIIGSSSAPYINQTLIAGYATASNFVDPLPLSIPSEPHYVWMEAGTNAFSDTTFTTDDDPSASNSTSSTEHLSTQIDAKGGLSWLAYQEGLDSTTGACPIHSSGFYQPKHDPFVFFQDVSGNPPSDTNAGCVAHHRPITSLASDLTQGKVASYNFVTPNLCNDMHGQFGCPTFDLVKPGDDWLAANLPAMISFCNDHDGVIFLVWDEGEATQKIPFVAVGPGVKRHYSSPVQLSHSSVVKTVERVFGLPTLATVANDSDLGDLFLPGALP